MNREIEEELKTDLPNTGMVLTNLKQISQNAGMMMGERYC